MDEYLKWEYNHVSVIKTTDCDVFISNVKTMTYTGHRKVSLFWQKDLKIYIGQFTNYTNFCLLEIGGGSDFCGKIFHLWYVISIEAIQYFLLLIYRSSDSNDTFIGLLTFWHYIIKSFGICCVFLRWKILWLFRTPLPPYTLFGPRLFNRYIQVQG